MILAIILAVFYSVYFGLFVQNIPYEQIAGVGGWIRSTELSWGTLLGYVFSPMSQGFTSNNENLIAIRVTESLVHKALYLGLGDSLGAIAVYNTILAVIFGLLIYWVVSKWTGNRTAGFLTSLFLMSAPAYGWAIMEYGDYSPLDQILLLVYVYLFLKFAKDKNSSGILKTIGAVVLFWVLGMLAMRVKDPNRYLIPAVSWTIVLFNGKRIWTALVSAVLTVPVFWVKKEAVDAGLQKINIETLMHPLYILFYNPDGYGGPEDDCSLFSLDTHFPTSVVSSYAFFLSWFFIAALAFESYRAIRGKKDFQGASTVPPLLIWAAVGTSFFAVFRALTFTRYMTWSLLPITLLFAVVAVNFLTRFKGNIRRWGSIAVIVFIFLQIGGNLQNSLYLRKGLERIWIPKWTFFAEVYKRESGITDSKLFELYKWWYTKSRREFTFAIEPYIYGDSEREGIVAKNPEELTDLESKIRKYGVFYIAANRPLEFPWNAELITTLYNNRFSWITAFKARFSRKEERKFYLYRLTL